ncbi:MAG: hypothetical protein R2695_18795 [Acidimicrobiales bacterium]
MPAPPLSDRRVERDRRPPRPGRPTGGRPRRTHPGVPGVVSTSSFDNLRKLVALHYGLPVIPGIEPADFFAAWELTGAAPPAGASNNALHALLCGLRLRRPASRRVDGRRRAQPRDHDRARRRARWLVDTAIVHDAPLALVEGRAARVDHGGYRTELRPDDRGWLLEFPTVAPTHPRCAGCSTRSTGPSPRRRTSAVGVGARSTRSCTSVSTMQPAPGTSTARC